MFFLFLLSNSWSNWIIFPSNPTEPQWGKQYRLCQIDEIIKLCTGFDQANKNTEQKKSSQLNEPVSKMLVNLMFICKWMYHFIGYCFPSMDHPSHFVIYITHRMINLLMKILASFEVLLRDNTQNPVLGCVQRHKPF